MRPVNAFRLVPFVCLFIFMALSLQSCDEDSCICIQAPIKDGGYDPVFNADGGFIITYGMLDKRYNEVTFPGTHNSQAGPDFWENPACKNQDLYVSGQLGYGIRYVEFDLNQLLNAIHGCDWCQLGPSINSYFEDIVYYASRHPHQIITARISDLEVCAAYECTTPTCFYERINGRLEDTGLDRFIYNWDCTAPKWSSGRCYIPDPWPTLREMIDSGKNVMFFHNRGYGEHGVFDEGLYEDISYWKDDLYYTYQAFDLEDLCKLTLRWAPPRDRQQEGHHRLFLIEVDPDQKDPSGSQSFASRSNDGRKLYQIANYNETNILPDGRAVNFITVDYYGKTEAGLLPINVVDACNRLNYERFGIDWKSCEGFWELYPYEFDDSKVEHITQVQALKDEVDRVIDDFNGGLDLDGHERTGKIVSTQCQIWNNWIRLPEWAVDNDFFTRWCAANLDVGHAWAIDLGEPKAIDEIAIAWEYPHHRPGYRVYASNDNSRFADGISQDELTSDDGWVLVAECSRDAGGPILLWDQVEFDKGTGISNWRYIRVMVTDTGVFPFDYDYPTFYELRLYGPAN